MKTGYVIKFGASTRLYIVKGPPDEAFDDEEEMAEAKEEARAAATSTEERIKKLGAVASEEAEIMLRMLRQRDGKEDEGEKEEDGGISWGFREDAKDEEEEGGGDGELTIDMAKMARPVEFKDPKKTFRGFFEREGRELDYQVTEERTGKSRHYVCKVELPIDTTEPVYAEGSSSKKKDAVLACAMNGCHLLDAYNVLRTSRKGNEDIETRGQKLAKNDFYDSDEDTFTDRTGEIEMKRKRRMVKAGVKDSVNSSKTHDMLTAELKEMNEEIGKLQKVVSDSKAKTQTEDLDEFMANVSANTIDSGTLREAKKRLFDLKEKRAKLERLCEMSKPVALPEARKLTSVPTNIMTGRVGKISLPSRPTPPPSKTPAGPSLPAPSSKITMNIGLKKKTEETVGKEDKPSTTPVIETPSIPISSFESSSGASDEQSDSYQEPVPEDVDQSAVKQDLSSPSESVKHDPSSESMKRDPSTETLSTKPSKKRKKKPAVTATLGEDVKWDDEYRDDFVNWMPPTGQTGDGRTKLNEKFGY
eukprot:sb/3463777/